MTTPSVAIVIDDLAAALVASPHPAGIQRVVAGIVDTALERSDGKAWPAVTIGTGGGAVRLDLVDPASLPWRGTGQRIGAAATFLRAGRSLARSLPLPHAVLRQAKRTYGKAAVAAGGLRTIAPVERALGLVVIPGAFWSGGSADRVRAYADAREARVSLLVHDVFPLTHPEWYPDDLRRDFAEALDTISPSLRRVVTLSQAVAIDLERCRPSLATLTRVATPSLAAHRIRRSAAAGATTVNRPFVLALGTVEPRKNHLLILEAWDTAREDERLAQARLVIAGRPGWLADRIESEIGREARSRGIVRLTDVSDAEVDGMLDGCVATVHASHAEGLGLPVRESIVRGIPTLISSGIPTDGLPADSFRQFPADDPNALAGLLSEVLLRPPARRPIELGPGTGWEPVLSALIDA